MEIDKHCKLVLVFPFFQTFDKKKKKKKKKKNVHRISQDFIKCNSRILLRFGFQMGFFGFFLFFPTHPLTTTTKEGIFVLFFVLFCLFFWWWYFSPRDNKTKD